MSARRRTATTAAALLAAVAASGCGVGYSGGGEGPLKGAKLTVGSKDFTEQQVLGQITVQYLRAKGAAVNDQTGLVSTDAVRRSLVNGDIDLYWEYTGTSWITFLGKPKPIADPKKQFDAVAAEDLEQHGIVWIDPSTINNTYAFAIKRSRARELGIRSLDDLPALLRRPEGQKLTFCVEAEFANRPDGFPGVQEAYGFSVPRNRVRRLDTGLIYSQTGNGSCSFGEIFTTDSRVASLDLLPLSDPRRFFPNYNAAVNVREDVLRRWPVLRRLMKPIADRLDNATMQRLNAQVDNEGELPEKVARDWLVDQRLIDD
ncbi:glycine betaine ABC transporter substrate-binding protein [Patulibacter defluvii]|uniref:glycine betaine ABC transporter substrate-binding protein n=1 Tax=Patulibacter defluvii TaxID=3095358 RepID=UPI002A75F4D3|nr:glycine betaine ABC transporter substrate-binding protein [Patulibacter sp. DM4]